MPTLRRATAPGLLAALAVVAAGPAPAQDVPSPSDHLGFEIGVDRSLASWSELTGYYEALARTSPRVSVDTLGATALGRPFVMLTVTARENHDRLEELREIQMKLADPRRIGGPDELEALLDEGRTVVLITHAIHSTEVGSAQVAARLLHRLATSDEPRIREILENVILLDVPSLNPDGTEMVVGWYRKWVGTEYEAAPLPTLYHHYVGHDDNRDWYAFTQAETRHAISGAHNAWHPQIVHDIHQMGSRGARIFFPPFIDPWEPNIDPALTASVNALGSQMAADLIGRGREGVVIHAQYDAYTPARAYQHYHAGARILSETASADLATPTTIAWDELRGRRGFDARERSWNFPLPWEGGEWRLSDIVGYMEDGALALLSHAAKNRRYWLESFHGINRRAVEGWREWPAAWAIPPDRENAAGLANVLWILRMGDVEVRRARSSFRAATGPGSARSFPEGTYVVPMTQPYASFAQTLLERQEYPERLQYPGGPPQRPYDVTAHTLPLLMDVEAVPLDEAPGTELSEPIALPELRYEAPDGLVGDGAPRIGVYKSWREPMTEGWTRWVLDRHGIAYDTLHDADIREGDLAGRYDVLLFESQSPESIVEGWSAGTLPEPYAGGLGSRGVRAVRSFVRRGGRLVAVEEAAAFAIDALELAVDDVTAGLPPRDFYIPGSILRLAVDGDHPVARGIDPRGIAWFWGSSTAFDVREPGARVVARYGAGDPLLSGWAMGAGRIADRPAVVEVPAGDGSVVVFAFPPNYRGQTRATWPLLFGALNAGE